MNGGQSHYINNLNVRNSSILELSSRLQNNLTRLHVIVY